MTNNLKIEVMVSNIPEDGSIASQFPSQEYVNQQLAKKANLSPEGRLDPSHAPDYTEIPGLYEHIEDTKDAIETSIADSLQAAKGYTNQQLSTGLQTKADLVNGKIPFDQIPFSADIEDQIQINVENITAVVDQKVAQVVEQVNGVATAANSYTDTKVAETKTYVDTTVDHVIEDVERFGVSKAVTIPTYLTPEAGVAAGTGVAAGAYYNVRSTEDDTMLVEYQNIGGVPTPSGGEYPSSVAVRNIAKYTALPFVTGETYGLHERVQLENGDRVQSTVSNNIIDPNVDMTGWKKTDDNAVESIADLIAIQNPKDGQVVQAKGFYEATNFALAQPYKGGGDFIYVSSKSTVNDGFMCFNGWTRQILDREYNAYMSGCKCDGVTDDTQNFDKIMYWLESNNQGGAVTIDGDLYINSEIEYKGKQQFVHEGGFNNGETIKVGIRLSCSNTTLNITGGSSIKFGLHFHDSNAYFISAVDQKFSGDYLYQGQLKNIRICGGGTIDFTGAGCISTTMKLRRYGVTTGLVDGFDCHDVKFLGGDLANCIANITTFGVDFEGVARKHNIYNCTFKDNFYDLNNISPYQSTSVDHSSIYINAPESSVWNNTFTQKSVWARSMGCAIELHGNDQQFHNNIIEGYCRSVIIAGYKSDQEVPRPELNTHVRTGISVTNNISYANYMISVWGRDLRFGTIDIANNTHNGLPKITPAELIVGGGDINPVNYPAFFHIVGDGGITATPNVQVLGGFFIRNNTFKGTFNTGFSEEQFALLANNYINSGLHFIDNKMSCPTQLRVVAGYQMNLYSSSWLRNKHIAPTAQATNKELFLLNLGFMQSCHIEVDLGFLGFRGSQELCRIDISDDATSVNNTIKINQPMQKWEASLKFLTGNILNKDSNFYLNNSIEYDGVTTVDVTTNLDTGLILSTTAIMPLGVKSVQLKSADVSRAIKFTLPMNYFKDFTGGGSSCSASTLKSDITETGSGLSITGFAKIIV